jgi:3-hydroxy-9,10-secoandrosta-1,3,5(10)-triene-9,17-dione monooxygenase
MLTADTALEQARVLRPRIAERAARCEAIRRCPEETIAELHASGLMRVMQPKRYGGSELGLDVISEVSFELSRACASTAWVWLNLATHAWNIAQFGAQAQEDVWGSNVDAVAATGLAFPCGRAEPVSGGFRVSGRWPFGSGVDAADWMIVGATTATPGAQAGDKPERRFFLVPKSDFRSLDNWHALGLTGTGSHDVEVKDAFVPTHRTVAAELLASGYDSPGAKLSSAAIYRLPAYAAFGFGLAGVPLGAARAALQDYLEGTRKRVATYGSGRLAELGPVQARIAEASASIAFAEHAFRANLLELNRLTETGVPIDNGTKLRWKRDLAFGVTLCKRAIETLMAASGAAGLSMDQPLQRHFRDIQAAGAHIGLTWDVQAAAYGRDALGVPMDPNTLI